MKRAISFLLVAALVFSAEAQTSVRLSSQFLARGEQAELEISVIGNRPDQAPVIPKVPGVVIAPLDIEPEFRGFLPGRRAEFVFRYGVSSYETGRHVIPAVTSSARGFEETSDPIPFEVFNPDELAWSETSVANIPFRYASAFRVLDTSPYEGECISTEIKLYIPAELNVEDWGIPDFQRDGLTAWRFQPSSMQGQINLLGRRYISVSYPSTITPTRAGEVAVGPASIRLVSVHRVIEAGRIRNVARETQAAVPKLTLAARPLPDGAPDGYDNAVGRFTLHVGSSLTEAREGDPIPVEMTVRGSGNLDVINAPKPTETDGWKLYEPSANQRGDERRNLQGVKIFQQFMRPLTVQPAIPSFRFVFFDPDKEAYETLESDPIPIRITPNPAASPTAPPGTAGLAPAAAVPVERMTDILGIIPSAELTRGGFPELPPWTLHVMGSLLAALLMARAIWFKVAPRFAKDPQDIARRDALASLERLKDPSDHGFLMAAGAFVERWLPQSDDSVRGILRERDETCFRPAGEPGTPLSPQRRRAILKILKSAATVIMICAMLRPVELHAEAPGPLAEKAFAESNYQQAAKLWFEAAPYGKLSADALYNIGNACYRGGSPGQAALFYRRALKRDANHQESLQNLRFIERKYGSISVKRPPLLDAIGRVPLVLWDQTFWGSLWLITLSLLVFPATRPGARIRTAAAVCLVMAPLLAGIAGLGLRYFPNDARFARSEEQGVIVAEGAVVHADASRTSPEVIDAPPGSFCKILKQSGRWTYISFATKTRGWVPSHCVEPIIPRGEPVAPTLEKPKATDSSA
jgi:hypothetical protein